MYVSIVLRRVAVNSNHREATANFLAFLIGNRLELKKNLLFLLLPYPIDQQLMRTEGIFIAHSMETVNPVAEVEAIYLVILANVRQGQDI